MKKFLFALAVAAVATTGLMADKCTYAPTTDKAAPADQSAPTEAPAPTEKPAQ